MKESIIEEVLNNIENIHNKVDISMADRKENHNIADNSSYINAAFKENEKKVYKTIHITEEEEISALESLIIKRKSIRDYKEIPITLEQVMKLMKYTFAYSRWIPGIYGKKYYPASYIPSAGGLAEITNYLLVRKVSGLESGIYRYNRENNNLEMLSKGHVYYHLPEVLYGLDFSVTSAFCIFICADMKRTAWKYGERSYRFAHMDAGIAAQNMHLLALNAGIGSCMIAGYKDKEVRKLLQLEKNEIPMLLMTFGAYDE